MEGWTWKALCNEVPFRFGKNLASGGIRTHDAPDPKSGVLTARPRGHFSLICHANDAIRNIPCHGIPTPYPTCISLPFSTYLPYPILPNLYSYLYSTQPYSTLSHPILPDPNLSYSTIPYTQPPTYTIPLSLPSLSYLYVPTFPTQSQSYLTLLYPYPTPI